ncbi:aldo/keto reductase [Aminobacter anthyllidis]|uniref:Aldo/keto reductase n=1 Tax=Aminobacter anthyllidis TaxID=1035067 RepID=A0A9X1ACC2_9HYPH|nr:aldo/keto reductase [Aminobacter anthyllidis]MBT1157154.1 aldo/keto reductase [Aminobacter anthyllidis]
MEKRKLGRTGLKISPLVLGGNVFGWTIDRKVSFDVLDAFFDHGFNAIDTADVYTAWVPGNKGGESESIIGAWLKARPLARDKIVIFTKVGSGTDGASRTRGLSESWISKAVEQSLKRLGVEAIDVYFSHWPDPLTPHDETLSAYAKLIEAGKVKAIGASNFNAVQLATALGAARTQGLPAYQVLQPEYNLYSHETFDGALRDLSIAEDIGVVNYYGLAGGFLSGKYRSLEDCGKSARGARMTRYFTSRGWAVLDALDAIGANHHATPAEVSLAWLMARKGVTAPIASATSVKQVESFSKAAGIVLSPDEVKKLDDASSVPIAA